MYMYLVATFKGGDYMANFTRARCHDMKSGPVMNVLMRLMILVVWLVPLQRQREEFLSFFSTFNLQSCTAFCLQEI